MMKKYRLLRGKTMKKTIVEYLINRYDLNSVDDVRYIDDTDYAEGAIECNGKMPNSTVTGWFFVGYESEIERDMRSTQ